MSCKGLHCDGCGGGGAAGAVIALLVIIAVAMRKAWPEIVRVVEVTAWTVAGITGTVIVVTCGVLTVRVICRRRARRAMRQVPYRATVIPAARLSGPPTIDRPARLALGQPRPRAAGSWPLPGWWEELRPRVGGDSDEHHPR
jgi:hypothetical protein